MYFCTVTDYGLQLLKTVLILQYFPDLTTKEITLETSIGNIVAMLFINGSS